VVILTGGIDLSVGSVVGMVNMLLAMLLTSGHMSIPGGVSVVILLATLIGLVNAILIFDLKLPPFIATLGTMTILRGATLLISKGSNVFGLPRAVSTFAQDKFLGMPYLFCVLIAVTLVVEFVLRRTNFGRYVYALGSNPEAARLSGVNTRLVTYGTYMLAGLLGGVAGSMETARLWMGVPTTGTMYELDAIAVAVLGGASLMGAEGNAYGAFIGALLMTTIYNGAVILGIDANYTKVFVGAVLVITVSVDQPVSNHAGTECILVGRFAVNCYGYTPILAARQKNLEKQIAKPFRMTPTEYSKQTKVTLLLTPLSCHPGDQRLEGRFRRSFPAASEQTRDYLLPRRWVANANPASPRLTRTIVDGSGMQRVAISIRLMPVRLM
jgi:ribose transport system permease protein